LAGLGLAMAGAAEPVIRRTAGDAPAGTARAVRVDDVPLVFTGQIVAANLAGDARSQADGALQALAARLRPAGADLAHVVRLNACVSGDADVEGTLAAVAAAFAGGGPAFTLIRTPLAAPGARVAFDAVAVATRAGGAVELSPGGTAVLPAGGKLFISGQAEKGTDTGSAVKQTMAGLHRSLAHVGLAKTDVVQVRAFLSVFGDHAAAAREIAASFDGAPVPPTVFVEWVSDLFTEIELVASARRLPAAPAERITHAWLPWLTKSPRYCHVTTVAAGTPLIFIGAIDGGGAGDARAQMKVMFERLGSTLFEAGSSFRHLAKATYFLAHPDSRALLGELRDVYYDPTRPPAASALAVQGLGRPGRVAALDLIAVPAR
jgi:enamine deaminase RidA (YjgF/YER057c/UK114 family)